MEVVRVAEASQKIMVTIEVHFKDKSDAATAQETVQRIKERIEATYEDYRVVINEFD